MSTYETRGMLTEEPRGQTKSWYHRWTLATMGLRACVTCRAFSVSPFKFTNRDIPKHGFLLNDVILFLVCMTCCLYIFKRGQKGTTSVTKTAYLPCLTHRNVFFLLFNCSCVHYIISKMYLNSVSKPCPHWQE